jgi:hypothetical protein
MGERLSPKKYVLLPFIMIAFIIVIAVNTIPFLIHLGEDEFGSVVCKRVISTSGFPGGVVVNFYLVDEQGTMKMVNGQLYEALITIPECK